MAPKHVSGLLVAMFSSLLLLAPTSATPNTVEKNRTNCTIISEQDAKVLVYLIPDAFKLRARGRDVAIDREPDSEGGTVERYVFRVDAVPQNPYGSSLVGYYDVDKNTGQVAENVTDRVVTSTTLKGVQKIMTAKGCQ
ncbi:MAG TPA: hypothetical protein VNE63_18615 [Candidatus Acidoferrales bacterium]|nr:hypothetical protein [Candidatus Acidoferrales bacterium]